MKVKTLVKLAIEKARQLYGKAINAPELYLKRIRHGKDVTIYGRLRVYGGRGRISIGDHVILRSETATNPLGGGEKHYSSRWPSRLDLDRE